MNHIILLIFVFDLRKLQFHMIQPHTYTCAQVYTNGHTNIYMFEVKLLTFEQNSPTVLIFSCITFNRQVINSQ